MEILFLDLTSRSVIKGLLKTKGIRPLKRFGQNFLISKSVLAKIVKSADLKKSDTVLEIGPGIGTLTQELAKRAKKVISVEKDKIMVEILRQTLKDFDNIEIIKDDILTTDYPLPTTNYKLIANLPYYITSPVIRKFLELENPPSQMILMVQKEVAQRICAKPPKMSLLAVSVQFYSEPEIVSFVSKSCFWPQPKVNSAIVRIVPRDSAYSSALFRERFFRIVRAGFAHPRKQLVNNLAFGLALPVLSKVEGSLSNGLALSLSNGVELKKEKVRSWLSKNEIDPKQRAQTLQIKDWKNLTKTFSKKMLL